MKKNIIYLLVLGLFLIGVSFIVEVNAGPIIHPYAICIYKGSTSFSTSATGWKIACRLILAVKASCDPDGTGNHHLHVVAAGSVPGDDPQCSAIATGGFPWGGYIAGGAIVGGQIDTAHNTPGLPSVGTWGTSGWDVAAFGVVSGITSTGTFLTACPSGTFDVPQSITVTSGGGLNFGGVARFDAVNLDRKSCGFVP